MGVMQHPLSKNLIINFLHVKHFLLRKGKPLNLLFIKQNYLFFIFLLSSHFTFKTSLASLKIRNQNKQQFLTSQKTTKSNSFIDLKLKTSYGFRV